MITATPGDGSGLPVGAYQFLGLRPGTYTIAEAGAAGFQPVGASVGIPGNGVATSRQIASIRLGPGVQAGGSNFGETKSAAIFAATVTVQRLRPTVLTLTFTGDVNPSGALDPGSYTLVRLRGGRKPVRIAIRRVLYDAAT